MRVEMREKILPILQSYPRKRESLIPVLQEVQGMLGYLPEEAVVEIAQFMGVSLSDIYGVASFYAQFRFQRQGQYSVKVCQGTACHVRGGTRIMSEVKQQIDIEPGQTTPDYKYSLERVACFGACALAPVMVVDKTVYGRMTTPQVKKILARY
ncbi:MAG: NADH-quinone oxidoreductase subunit NuoE [Dehalococcoidia bacterium]|nr:NADH-quinone oxidoreductase subunit NuoE [Dehalococcoidia bacterium]